MAPHGGMAVHILLRAVGLTPPGSWLKRSLPLLLILCKSFESSSHSLGKWRMWSEDSLKVRPGDGSGSGFDKWLLGELGKISNHSLCTSCCGPGAVYIALMAYVLEKSCATFLRSELSCRDLTQCRPSPDNRLFSSCIKSKLVPCVCTAFCFHWRCQLRLLIDCIAPVAQNDKPSFSSLNIPNYLTIF